MRIGWKGWIVAAIAAVIVVLVFRGVVGLAIYAAGVAIYWLVGMRKIARWNNDPRQQKLIQLFHAAGRSGDLTDEAKITDFLCEQSDWSLNEDRKRIAHALSFVERISDRTITSKADEIGLRIARAINDGHLRGA